MFAQIMGAVLKPEKSSPDLAVLNIELLAYNFHESLNLKPLLLMFAATCRLTKRNG